MYVLRIFDGLLSEDVTVYHFYELRRRRDLGSPHIQSFFPVILKPPSAMLERYILPLDAWINGALLKGGIVLFLLLRPRNYFA